MKRLVIATACHVGIAAALYRISLLALSVLPEVEREELAKSGPPWKMFLRALGWPYILLRSLVTPVSPIPVTLTSQAKSATVETKTVHDQGGEQS